MQYRRPAVGVFTFAIIIMSFPQINTAANPFILMIPLFLLIILGVVREGFIDCAYAKEDKLIN
jgi:prepilin signal peptidase PulO-like enzyme (type II secretory pathway)